MIQIGLTGGIGSGKTTVAKIFEKKGIPVYYADDQAKKLMQTHPKLIRQIQSLLGEKAYVDNKLNARYIAGIVFDNKKKLAALEQIVHPAVWQDFLEWSSRQKAPCVIMENAVLHKSGMDKQMDFVILVTANDDLRKKRVQKRDQLSAEEVAKRIKNQDKNEKLLKKSDFLIKNDFSISNLREEVEKILQDVNFKLNKR